MHPAVGKVDFDSVNGRRIKVCVGCSYTGEQGIGVDSGLKVNFLFGHRIVRVGRAERGTGLAPFGQVGQEERHAHQGVAAIVQLGQNDSAVALASKHRLARLHFSDDVHLSHGRCGIG